MYAIGNIVRMSALDNTKVVNIRYETADVYCGRGTPLGNRFGGKGKSRMGSIARYREWFQNRVDSDPAFRAYVLSLTGKRLGCHCKPLPCHVDVVVEWISGRCDEASHARPQPFPER